MREPVVAFDLDQTLVDTMPAVAAVLSSTSDELGLPVDVAEVVAGLGPPLEDVLAHQLPLATARLLATAYRRRYIVEGPRHAVILPGAHAAIAAVRRHGGDVVVVTGQSASTAIAHLVYAGFDVDVVTGSVWGPAKADALRSSSTFAYVGDHPADVTAAHAAGALAVGVTTGRHDATALAAADAVLPSLVALPEWLSTVQPWAARGRTAPLDS